MVFIEFPGLLDLLGAGRADVGNLLGLSLLQGFEFSFKSANFALLLLQFEVMLNAIFLQFAKHVGHFSFFLCIRTTS